MCRGFGGTEHCPQLNTVDGVYRQRGRRSSTLVLVGLVRFQGTCTLQNKVPPRDATSILPS